MLGSTWSEAFQRGGQDGKEATHSGADHHCTEVDPILWTARERKRKLLVNVHHHSLSGAIVTAFRHRGDGDQS